MRRQLFNSALFIFIFLYLVLSNQVPALALDDEVHYTVTGSGTGSAGVIIDWRGPDSTLQYGLTTTYGTSVTGTTPSIVPFSSSGPFWEVSINNLNPGAVYHYKIGNNTNDFTFKTAPTVGSSGFKFDAIADVGAASDYPNVAAVANVIKNDNPDFVLIPGDLTYGNTNGQQAVDNHFNDEMVWSANYKNYAAAYMAAWGNHEWDTSGDDLRNYKGRFGFPNSQTSPGSPSVSCCGEDWYWFDYGNVRFIAYPEPFSGAWSDWKTKVTPIMDAAQSNSNIKFIVTFGHRPAYSSGYHSGDSTLAGYMATLGSNHSKYVLNINGHSHDYERTYPQSGVTHITVGIGGSSLEQNSGGSACGNMWNICPAPSYTAKRYMHLGVLSLTVTSGGIQGSYICGPAGGGSNDVTCNTGDIIDSFTIGSPSATNPPVVTPTPGPTAVPTATPVPVTGYGTKHFTANETNPDGTSGIAAAQALGFRIHDTGMSTSSVNALPVGSQAMVWVGVGNTGCSTSLNSDFISFVSANATNPKLYGFYLTDEPLDNSCVAAVTAYTSFIHQNAPGKKSFILLTDWPGTYAGYRPAVTGVDLIGLDPYPVKNGTYNANLIPQEVNNAVASGIPLNVIVPVFQTFGGEGWDAPTAAQLTSILNQWAGIIPNPDIDYAYSWGTQNGALTEALATRPDWQTIIAQHNKSTLAGDINNDGVVNILDIGIIVDNYGKTGSPGFTPADINRDGEVNIIDIGIAIDNYSL